MSFLLLLIYRFNVKLIQIPKTIFAHVYVNPNCIFYICIWKWKEPRRVKTLWKYKKVERPAPQNMKNYFKVIVIKNSLVDRRTDKNISETFQWVQNQTHLYEHYINDKDSMKNLKNDIPFNSDESTRYPLKNKTQPTSYNI